MIVPRARWPETDGFEEEAAVFPTENVFQESFLVIFCLYIRGVGREEQREDSERVDGGGKDDSFLRCMFVVGSAG